MLKKKERFIFLISRELVSPQRQCNFDLLDYYNEKDEKSKPYRLHAISLPVIFKVLVQRALLEEIDLIYLCHYFPDYWKEYFHLWGIPVVLGLEQVIQSYEYSNFVFLPEDKYYSIAAQEGEGRRYFYYPALWQCHTSSRLL